MFPFDMDLEDDVTLVASVLIAEGVDIKIELESENMDIRKIQKATVLDVRNHVMTDKSTSCQFQVSYHQRKRYEEKSLRKAHTYKNYSFLLVEGGGARII